MAAWPQLDELKRIIDVTDDDHDLTLARLLAAAIDHVKRDVGDWDDLVDVPDESLAHAALRLAEIAAERPAGERYRSSLGERFRDPTYSLLMYGHRRKFGVA